MQAKNCREPNCTIGRIAICHDLRVLTACGNRHCAYLHSESVGADLRAAIPRRCPSRRPEADSHAKRCSKSHAGRDLRNQAGFRLALRLAGMTNRLLRIRFARDSDVEAVDGVTLRDRDVDTLSPETKVRHL